MAPCGRPKSAHIHTSRTRPDPKLKELYRLKCHTEATRDTMKELPRFVVPFYAFDPLYAQIHKNYQKDWITKVFGPFCALAALATLVAMAALVTLATLTTLTGLATQAALVVSHFSIHQDPQQLRVFTTAIPIVSNVLAGDKNYYRSCDANIAIRSTTHKTSFAVRLHCK